MWKRLVKEVRGALRPFGWKLVLYSSVGELKGYQATGVSDERRKLLSLATYDLTENEKFVYLSHEFGHFLQYVYSDPEERDQWNWAFDIYGAQLGDPGSQKKSDTKAALPIVALCEYDAYVKGDLWLRSHGLVVKDIPLRSNQYNVLIKYSFQTGEFPKVQKVPLNLQLKLSNEFISLVLQRKPLSKSQISIIDTLSEQYDVKKP